MTLLRQRYEVRDKLGEGGMAEVYRATQIALDREVAIKFIKPGLTDEMFAVRFEREAKAIARLSHPNIMQVYDFDQAEDGRCFMVTELLHGSDLATRLQALNARGERFPLPEAVRITRTVAQALYYAHQRSVIHRDVKPHNIFLTEDNRVVVMDFGIARVISEGHLTATGMTVGTPHYFAPEQGGGQPVDYRADIYALGVVFYELLTGHVPYDADSTLGILAQHASAPIPDPREDRSDLPPAVTAVIRRAMAKEPADRYPDMAALIGALDELAEDVPPEVDTVVLDRSILPPTALQSASGPPSTVPFARTAILRPRLGKLWIGIGVLVVALALIGGGLLVLGGGDDDSSDHAGLDLDAVTVSPAAAGEYLFVVSNFVGDEAAGVDVAPRIANSLRADALAGTLGDRFRLEEIPQEITSREDAEALAQATGAFIVVWGMQDAAGLEVVVQAHGYPPRTLHELRFIVPPGADFGAILADEALLVTSLYVQALSLQRLMTDSEFIPLLLVNLNRWDMGGERALRVIPSTPLDRAVMDMMLATTVPEDNARIDAATTEALALAPDDPVLYFIRWSANTLASSRPDRAWVDAQRIAELLPPGNGFGAWVLTATAFFSSDYDFVIEYTGEIDDRTSEAYLVSAFYREMALLERGYFQTALDELNQLDAQDFEAFTGFPAMEAIRGLIYEINGDTEKAEADRQTVRASRLLERTAGMFSDLYNMANVGNPPALMLFGGYVAEVNGGDALAATVYGTALAGSPDDYLIRWRRAILAEKAGDYPAAYDHYMRAAENAPTPFPVASYQLARLIHDHGDALAESANVCAIIATAQSGVRTDLEFYGLLRDQIAALHEQLEC